MALSYAWRIQVLLMPCLRAESAVFVRQRSLLTSAKDRSTNMIRLDRAGELLAPPPSGVRI
jgi:hypothetical protein